MSLKHLLSARRCSTCWGCSCELSKFCTLMEPTFQWSRRGIFLGVRSQSLPFYTWGSDGTARSRNSPEVTQLVQVVGTQAVSSFTHGTIEHPPSHNRRFIYIVFGLLFWSSLQHLSDGKSAKLESLPWNELSSTWLTCLIKSLWREICDPHAQTCPHDTHQQQADSAKNLSSAVNWLLSIVQVTQLCFLLWKRAEWRCHLILHSKA